MRFKVLFLFTFFSSFSALANPYCFDFFAKRKLVYPKLELQGGDIVHFEKNEQIFSLEDNAKYIFEGRINDLGELSLTALLSYPDLGVRSRLQGAQLYQQMMDHFGLAKIKTIKGRWFDGTNYDQYFYYLNQGFTDRQAARMTWTGRQAAKYGFTEVREVTLVREKNGIVYMKVEYVRPEAKDIHE